MKSKIQFLLAFAMMFVMLGAFEALAQVPQLFNYQGIARDAKGNPLSNQKMSLKLSVLPTADATVAEYEETQLVNTNEFGLVHPTNRKWYCSKWQYENRKMGNR